MVESTNPGAISAAASVASLQKTIHDFQAEQAKSLAILAVPGIAMAASRARQQSEARANEMLAQQQQMNHQLWIQNQLLSGRSMQDINEEIEAQEARIAAAAPEKMSFLVSIIAFPVGLLMLGLGFWALLLLINGLLNFLVWILN